MVSVALLIAVPVLGCVGCRTLRSHSLSALAIAIALGTQLLLATRVDGDFAIATVVLQADDLARLLLVSATLAAAAATAISATRTEGISSIPLLIVAPVSGALLLRANPMLAILMLQFAWLVLLPTVRSDAGGEEAASLRYLSVVVAGTSALIVAFALLDSYRTDHNPFVTKLIISFAVVGWGMLLGAFPFHFWLLALYRASGGLFAMASLAMIRLVVLGIVLGTFFTFPWLLSDQRTIGLLLVGAAVVALGNATLSMTQSRMVLRIAYVGGTDLGWILAGAATGSGIGLTGALLATINHTLALLLIAMSITSLMSTSVGEQDRLLTWMRRTAMAGLGLGILALLGVPLTSGFLGRWLIYQASWEVNPLAVVALAVASGLSLISALGFARVPSQIPSGSTPSRLVFAKTKSTTLLSVGVVTALTIVLAIGCYPGPLVGMLTRFVATQ